MPWSPTCATSRNAKALSRGELSTGELSAGDRYSGMWSGAGRSPSCRSVLLAIFPPAGMEGWFEEALDPAGDKSGLAPPPTPDLIARMLAAGPTYGVCWAWDGVLTRMPVRRQPRPVSFR